LNLPAILALARSGATSQAWAAFEAAGLGTVADNPAVLTLKGRLLKDRARQATGDERQEYFAQSGDAYAAAATLCPTDSYPLINAATMAFFAGNAPQALTIAKQALALIDDGIDPGETPYWREATRAEALLLTGDTVSAKAAMEMATQRAPLAWEDRAVTLRQLRLISKERGESIGWIAAFSPPSCLHYSGMIGIDPHDESAAKSITDAVVKIAPGFGFGALAAGADILIAEALIAQDATLNVILPCGVAAFRAHSVSPFGAAWEPRFDALIEAADNLYIVEQHAVLSDAAIALASEVAMGCALECATRYESVAVSLRVPAKDKSPPADLWISAARPVILLPLSSTNSVPSPPLMPAQRVCYLAIADNPEMPLLAGCLKNWQEHNVMIQAFADIDTGLSALALLTGNRVGDTKAAIDMRITNIGMEDANQRSRMARMAKAAVNGTVIMGKSAAMLAEFDPDSGHSEPLGEMASNDGAIEIYAYRPAALS
jgi:hypothetical protein